METLKSVMDALREALTKRRGVVWLAVKQRAKFEGWLKPVEVSDGVGVAAFLFGPYRSGRALFELLGLRGMPTSKASGLAGGRASPWRSMMRSFIS